jgi:UDP-N-acetylmuramoyl-tripeptide--D-alanyl-D-alanine ligase
MAPYARVLRPDIVVVTSIGSEHHRSLGTLESTRTEKAEMARALSPSGIAVLNGDDPNVLWMRSQTNARIVTFGFGEANDVRASNVRLDWPHGTRFQLHVDGETREMTVRLLGRHMLLPILAAVAVARAEGLPLDTILPPLQQLAPTRGRLEPIALPNDIWIIRDDDKSALETVHTALDMFAQIPAKRRLIVIGDVSEPTGSQGPIYLNIGERLAKIVSLVVSIGTDKNRRCYMGGVERGGLNRSAVLYAGHSALRAVEILRQQLQPGDVVLLKGRYEQHLERIALSLMGRNVQCDIKLCRIKRSVCADCPMLERGWQSDPPVT